MRACVFLVLVLVSSQLFAAPEVSEPSTSTSMRREMLQWHQITGLATWGFWLATNLEGEKALHSLRRTAEPTANALLLLNPQENLPLYYALMSRSEWKATRGGGHRALAGATVAAYALTAGLSVLAPSRERESTEFDTVSAHKLLALFHLAALASMPALGKRIEHGGPKAAHSMQRAGWAGLGALTVSIGVFYF
ncbi:MAG: hypothetical protein K8S54_15285 [Spirochaetia bacterium]|nr:hypothetical protein [Spirochaetia bacterium]